MGRRGSGLALIWLYGGRENGLALTSYEGLGNLVGGEDGGINGHCSPVAKFPSLWGASWAECHGSVGQFWPVGQR